LFFNHRGPDERGGGGEGRLAGDAARLGQSRRLVGIAGRALTRDPSCVERRQTQEMRRHRERRRRVLRWQTLERDTPYGANGEKRSVRDGTNLGGACAAPGAVRPGLSPARFGWDGIHAIRLSFGRESRRRGRWRASPETQKAQSRAGMRRRSFKPKRTFRRTRRSAAPAPSGRPRWRERRCCA